MVTTVVEPQLMQATLLAEHRALTTLYESFIRAQQSDDDDGADVWAEFDALLLAHLDAEEKTLVYELYKARPREARVLITEHNHIRARLLELRAARARGKLPPDVARSFYHELCAQMRSEESVLYCTVGESLEDGRAGAANHVPAPRPRGSE